MGGSVAAEEEVQRLEWDICNVYCAINLVNMQLSYEQINQLFYNSGAVDGEGYSSRW